MSTLGLKSPGPGAHTPYAHFRTTGSWPHRMADLIDAPTQTKIDPTWYGSLSKASLQINIQDSSVPPFMSTGLAGPTFLVTYDAKAALASLSGAGMTPTPTSAGATASPSSKWEIVRNFLKQGLTKGQIAAAVVMPILAVATFLLAYTFWNRRKEAAKRKQWREKMDQRMSTISIDWKPVSAAGGHAAVRQSMVADRNTRTSSFYGRPSSQFVTEIGPNGQPISRPRTTLETNRVSRVSFAVDTYSRPPRPAVPLLPAAYRKSALSQYEDSPETSENASPDQGVMSPTQRQGAFVLDDESIRDRLGANNANNFRDSGDLARELDTMPAIASKWNPTPKPTSDVRLSVMRNEPYGHENSLGDEVSSPITPMTPALTREPAEGTHRVYSIGAYSGGTDSMVDNRSVQSYFSNGPTVSDSSDPDQALRQYAVARSAAQPTASPFAGFAAGPGLAAAAGLDMSSPDAIFRAYAATRPAQPPAAVTAHPTGNVMRTLYGPNMVDGLMRPRAGTMDDQNAYWDSRAPSTGSQSDEVGRAN